MFRRFIVSMLESSPLPDPHQGAKTKTKAKLGALTKTRDKARADLIEAYESANDRMYIIGDIEKAYTAACEALAAAQLAEDKEAAAGRLVIQ
ncbi:MAG: hypothetical protein M3Z96_04580 [Pseudomonadota bacterium]|nr:hypothetical protein [Pseudomonadota bacterium]